MTTDTTEREHAEGMLKSVSNTIHATIDDVGSWMIKVARLGGRESIEVRYGDTTLYAKPDTEISDIRKQFETQSYARLWPRMASAR